MTKYVAFVPLLTCYRKPKKNKAIPERWSYIYYAQVQRKMSFKFWASICRNSPYLYNFIFFVSQILSISGPFLQFLKEPVCTGALRPQPEAWPGASTDNLVWGRFNLQKPNSRAKISNSSFHSHHTEIVTSPITLALTLTFYRSQIFIKSFFWENRKEL
uniref:Uncharacterized protein n=1 Tax=Pipistrellus kuhlii TaxID=59472 RepID=A0A7J7XV27_PIPKU|nr:hypothetical protein mPipKuh1_010488 [Pipistrellus kuhlii]